MPPQKSLVWKHFKRLADDKTVKCNLCGTELTYNGGTTSMHNHLRMKHEPETQKKQQQENQPPMTTFINSPRKLTPTVTENLTQAIADMIVSDYLPLSIVESDGFRKLMQLAVPDYTVPCRKTIRSRILKKYEDEKKSLTTDLNDVSAVSITTDTWTSTSTDSYITVTEHHITDQWKSKSSVLMTRAMPERHTGENLAKKIKDCVSEFELENKVEACVHDNARNMECAGELCPGWSDIGCFAHTLQLCIKPALEIPQVSKIVSRCRKLVGHFRHSTTLTAEMRKRQKLLDVPAHELIQDVPTRWNSSQLMLERMCEQRRVITDIMLDSKLTKKSDLVLLPSDNEWQTMCELSTVLKDLTKVTTFMSSEKDVSISYIYPIVCGLLNNSLREKDDDSSVVKRVKQGISEELQRRFKPDSMETATSLPALASLLDPRYKRLPFFSSRQRISAEEALESRLDDIPLKVSSRDESSPPSSKVQKVDDTPGFLVFESPSKCDESDELKDYLLEKPSNVKPLEWWKQNEQKYPRLAVVARKLLAVPATSVPSERIFSSAGVIVTKLRNRLAPALVDSIIFLNKNCVQSVMLEECEYD